ncbi:MAG: heme-degrading domain-containing protein [Acidobacteriota bacterium]|nr:heme-degrading domain-containing protein [Acidobacteriota bacterium]MDE3162652.1 heme-degrading domain-containing protein [Acidobacteriota bacterium]
MALKEDFDRIAEQERELVFPHFDKETAWQLGLRLRTLAEERNLPIVIDVRRFGEPLFYAALDGTTPDNVEWVRRKCNVVARFHRSSYAVGIKERLKNETIYAAQGLSLADYATHGGAFPITVAGSGVIGSVTISGLPQRSDHELVVEVLCMLLRKDYANLRLAPE